MISTLSELPLLSQILPSLDFYSLGTPEQYFFDTLVNYNNSSETKSNPDDHLTNQTKSSMAKNKSRLLSKSSVCNQEMREKKLLKQHRRNMRLSKKISKILKHISTLKTELKNQIFEENRTHKCEEPNYCCNKVEVSRLKQSVDSKIESLETLRPVILHKVNNWTPGFTFKNHELISILEKYKIEVQKTSIKYDDEKTNTIVTKLKLWLAESIPFKRKDNKKITVNTWNITTKGPDKIWDNTDAYFSSVPHHVIEQNKFFGDINFPQILNMYAINRLSAILKMVQYCDDNGILYCEFKEGRILQKVLGLYKMKNADSFAKDSEYFYPSPTEMEYLMSLEPKKILDEISRLKIILFAYEQTYEETTQDIILKNLGERNKTLMGRIFNRIKTEAPSQMKLDDLTQSQIESNSLIEKYTEMIPGMKRMHENLMKIEKGQGRQLKSNKRKYLEHKAQYVTFNKGSETKQIQDMFIIN